jgi:hypothetical protein
MTRIHMIAFATVLLVAQAAFAQAPGEMPKPSPELKKLDIFAGNWSSEGTTQESPFGPAGKFSIKEHTEWFPGDFFLVSHSNVKVPSGDVKGLAIMGYDRMQKVYTYHAIDSMGMEESATGTVAGDTWTWTTESMMGGKEVKGRYSIKELSPTSMSFKYEMSTDGGPWKLVMEGTSTKEGSMTTAK